MLNLYESVRSNPSFNKFEIGNLLFAEYTCPVGAAELGQWSDSDYLVHVLSGKKRQKGKGKGSVLMNVKPLLVPQRRVCGQRSVLCVHKNSPVDADGGHPIPSARAFPPRRPVAAPVAP